MKILFIRRDNIGDLLCTTPAIHAVREKFPGAKVGVLVNTYNADVILNNPDVDEVYIYEKTKHAPHRNRVSVWLKNLKVLRKIRKEKYHIAIGCGSYSPTLARFTFLAGALMRIGYCPSRTRSLFYNYPVIQQPGGHEVIKTFHLLTILKIDGEPGELILRPDSREKRSFENFRASHIRGSARPLVAIAISTRIRKNKWSMENFTALVRRILSRNNADVLLLWAPGSENNPTFPGDDESAARIVQHFDGQVLAYPTSTLKSLIAAIALSDVVVTLDTGSLHIAAALRKPTVALMTAIKSSTWYPWKTRNLILTGEKSVEEIPVDKVDEAVDCLTKEFYGDRTVK